MGWTPLEYEFGTWIEFGVHPDGRVDIQQEPQGILIAASVRQEDAARIMADRNKLLERIAALELA